MRTRAHTRRETPPRRGDHGDRGPRPAVPAPMEPPRIRRLVVFESPLAASRPAQPPELVAREIVWPAAAGQ